jgi:hypothetical protein
MITDTANDNDCAADCPVLPLADYVARNGAYAGINGTYFCPTDYPDCANKKNSYDFPVYNSRLGKWLNATNLFWNNRSMVLKNGELSFLRNANSYGGGGSAGIVNHPGVLTGMLLPIIWLLTARKLLKELEEESVLMTVIFFWLLPVTPVFRILVLSSRL